MSNLIDRSAIKLPPHFFEDVDNVPRFYDWLNSLPTASMWHRVEERLPDDSREVIIFTVSKVIGVGSFIRPNWYQWYSGGGLPVDVTHWMPLPEPPKEEENDNNKM